MVWEAENGSSLTFTGTQISNMSDEGEMNNNKEVFTVFVNLSLKLIICSTTESNETPPRH